MPTSTPLTRRIKYSNLQPTARSGKADSVVAKSASGRVGGEGEGGSGKCSQLTTANMSEADNEETLDAAGVLGNPNRLLCDPVDAKVNGKVAVNSMRQAQAAAGSLAGAVDAHGHLPRTVITANCVQKTLGRHENAAIGVPVPCSTAVDEYPIDLFDVLEAWVFERMREEQHAEFMLSGHFQEYTRFLHVQDRRVTENDFILFRVLGRGGFGAVNGKMTASPIVL